MVLGIEVFLLGMMQHQWVFQPFLLLRSSRQNFPNTISQTKLLKRWLFDGMRRENNRKWVQHLRRALRETQKQHHPPGTVPEEVR